MDERALMKNDTFSRKKVMCLKVRLSFDLSSVKNNRKSFSGRGSIGKFLKIRSKIFDIGRKWPKMIETKENLMDFQNFCVSKRGCRKGVR